MMRYGVCGGNCACVRQGVKDGNWILRDGAKTNERVAVGEGVGVQVGRRLAAAVRIDISGTYCLTGAGVPCCSGHLQLERDEHLQFNRDGSELAQNTIYPTQPTASTWQLEQSSSPLTTFLLSVTFCAAGSLCTTSWFRSIRLLFSSQRYSACLTLISESHIDDLGSRRPLPFRP